MAAILALVLSAGGMQSSASATQADFRSDSVEQFMVSCNVVAAQPWRSGNRMFAGGYANCDTTFSGTFYWSLVYANPGSGADPRVARFSYYDTNNNFDANNSVGLYSCPQTLGYYSAVTIESDGGSILISDFSTIAYVPLCYQ